MTWKILWKKFEIWENIYLVVSKFHSLFSRKVDKQFNLYISSQIGISSKCDLLADAVSPSATSGSREEEVHKKWEMIMGMFSVCKLISRFSSAWHRANLATCHFSSGCGGWAAARGCRARPCCRWRRGTRRPRRPGPGTTASSVWRLATSSPTSTMCHGHRQVWKCRSLTASIQFVRSHFCQMKASLFIFCWVDEGY